jgi:hypothetical protein
MKYNQNPKKVENHWSLLYSVQLYYQSVCTVSVVHWSALELTTSKEMLHTKFRLGTTVNGSQFWTQICTYITVKGLYHLLCTDCVLECGAFSTLPEASIGENRHY